MLWKHIGRHIIFYGIILPTIAVGAVSYYRFVVKHDYLVSYQAPCDPNTGKCFVDCTDDACSTKDYYLKVQKYEPDLYLECGEDITGCAQASLCLPQDRECQITYCDSSKKGSDCSSVSGD